jgi:hypothetical protein
MRSADDWATCHALLIGHGGGVSSPFPRGSLGPVTVVLREWPATSGTCGSRMRVPSALTTGAVLRAGNPSWLHAYGACAVAEGLRPERAGPHPRGHIAPKTDRS